MQVVILPPGDVLVPVASSYGYEYYAATLGVGPVDAITRAESRKDLLPSSHKTAASISHGRLPMRRLGLGPSIGLQVEGLEGGLPAFSRGARHGMHGP
jgi:hypothetical protein